MKTGFIRALTLCISISFLFQSLFISEPEDPLVLCIGSEGHIVIENPDHCTFHENNDNQKDTSYNITSYGNQHDFVNNSCYDIYLSNLDLFDFQLKSNIHVLLHLFAKNTSPRHSNFTKAFRRYKPFNQFLQKILIEYSHVSLLL